MKPFDKEEYNRLCAKFLGWKTNSHKTKWINKYPASNPLFKYEGWLGRELLFHLDWNWIMEIVEKIYSLDIYYDKYIDHNSSQFTSGKFELSTKKEAVVQAIWEFLNWYYENHKD